MATAMPLLLMILATASRTHAAASGTAARTADQTAAALTTSLRSYYESRSWAAALALFADPTLGEAFVGRLQQLNEEGVDRLTIRTVHAQALEHGQAAVTIQLAADSRATPEYDLFRARSVHGAPRISGRLSGVSGVNYLHAGWAISRSAHFTIYHSRYQLQGFDRRGLSDLEYQRSRFEHLFGVRVVANIRYYLYPQQTIMRQFTIHTHGACGLQPENIGCADPYVVPPTIHASVWPTFHEPIHMYELALQPRPVNAHEVLVAPNLIAEGTAVALEDRQVDPRLSDYCSDLAYAPLDACARIALRHVNAANLFTDKGFASAHAGFAYALGGSLVKYLILHHGYHAFARFYYVLAAQPTDKPAAYDVAARRTYHLSMNALLHSWTRAVCGGRCR